MIYSIRGYQSSLKNKETTPQEELLKEGIHLDTDGHPCLLKEGKWVRWENLKTEIQFDREKRELVSIDGKTDWNYYYNPLTGDCGLNPQSRYKQVRPIYQLSEEEMKTLGVGKKKYALQVFTSDNSMLSKVSHVGLRLINENGQVYSLGYETPTSEVKYTHQAIAGCYDATIASLDYDEFAKFKTRRVTTLPISQNQYDMALSRVKKYSQKPLRFNRAYQNCATYVTDIMRQAQIHETPSIACTVKDSLWDLVTEIPYIGIILNKIKNVVQAVFELLSVIPLIGLAFKAIIYVNNKVFTVLGNLFVLSLGGGKGSKPNADALEDSIDNRNELTYFKLLYTHWGDLLSEKTDKVHAPKRLVDWQLEQKETYIHKFEGPKFYIVPPKTKKEG